MVAEPSVRMRTAARTLHGGRATGAMGEGRIVCFPDWETLERMPAEKVKGWLLSKKHIDDAHFLAMVGSQVGHRGPGSRLPHAHEHAQPVEPQQARQAQPDRSLPEPELQELVEARTYEELTQELRDIEEVTAGFRSLVLDTPPPAPGAAAPPHAFHDPGVYRVRLTVADDGSPPLAGQDVVTVTVTQDQAGGAE